MGAPGPGARGGSRRPGTAPEGAHHPHPRRSQEGFRGQLGPVRPGARLVACPWVPLGTRRAGRLACHLRPYLCPPEAGGAVETKAPVFLLAC